MTREEAVKAMAEMAIGGTTRGLSRNMKDRREQRAAIVDAVRQCAAQQIARLAAKERPAFILLCKEIEYALIDDGEWPMSFQGISLLFTDDIGPTDFAFISKERTFTAI